MRSCPRCRSSMLLDYLDVREGGEKAWRCLACGHELLADTGREGEERMDRDRVLGVALAADPNCGSPEANHGPRTLESLSC